MTSPRRAAAVLAILVLPIECLAATDSVGMPALLWLWVVFVGLCIGSFLNVVIHRLPIMMLRDDVEAATEVLEEVAAMDLPDGHPANCVPAHAAEAPAADPESEGEATPYNLAVPRSACPKCGHAITAIENVPVVSWLVLRGRCRGCSEPISARYPLIELITAAATIAVVVGFGFTWLTLWICVLTWGLLAASMIDLDTQLLPDTIVLPLLWLGLLVNVGESLTSLESAVIGAAAGYLSLWSVNLAFARITGKQGMGHGDFKLLAALGAWLGWEALPWIVLGSSLTGIVGALCFMAVGRTQRGEPIPFGPFLASAGWLLLLWAAPGF